MPSDYWCCVQAASMEDQIKGLQEHIKGIETEKAALHKEKTALIEAVLKNSQVIVNTPPFPESEAINILHEQILFQQREIYRLRHPEIRSGMAASILYEAQEHNKKIRRMEQEYPRLVEENDLQRDSIQQLSAQVAAYRKTITDCGIMSTDGCECPDCKAVRNCENLLTQPDPGAEIRERLAKLEAENHCKKEVER